jgi:hypothetical protein
MVTTMSKGAARTFVLGVVVTAVVAAGLGSATAASAARAQKTSSTSARQGDAAKARYDTAMKRIGREYAKGIGVIYPLVSGTKGSPVRAATIRHLEAGDKTLAAVEAELKRTQAPAHVWKLHKRLMADVGKLRMEMVGMIQSLRSDNVVHFMTLSGLAALPAVNNTIDLIQLDGYKFLGKSTVTAPCGDC